MASRFRQRVRGRFCARPDEVTLSIPWRAPIRESLGLSVIAVVCGRLGDLDSAWLATMTGLLATASVGGLVLSRPTTRHRVVLILNFVVLIIAPCLAIRLLPATYRHEWYAVYPVSFATAVLAVYAYVALSRLPGFGPLELPPTEKRSDATLVVRPWTPDERATRLGASDRTIFRRAYPIVFNALAFAFLTFVSFGLHGRVG